MYAEFKERAEYVSFSKIIDKISTWRSREKSRATYSFYKWNKLGNLCTNELNLFSYWSVYVTHLKLSSMNTNQEEKLQTWKRIESTPRHKSEDFLSEIKSVPDLKISK